MDHEVNCNSPSYTLQVNWVESASSLSCTWTIYDVLPLKLMESFTEKYSIYTCSYVAACSKRKELVVPLIGKLFQLYAKGHIVITNKSISQKELVQGENKCLILLGTCCICDQSATSGTSHLFISRHPWYQVLVQQWGYVIVLQVLSVQGNLRYRESGASSLAGTWEQEFSI